MILSIVLPFLILLSLSYVSLRRRPPKGYRLVPGPKGLPLIGNTLDVPQSRPEKKFMEWAREFGELYRIQMGWNDWVFVNSDVAAKVWRHTFHDSLQRKSSTSKVRLQVRDRGCPSLPTSFQGGYTLNVIAG